MIRNKFGLPLIYDFNIGSTLAVNKYNKREKEERA